jgi:hypothetical protein
MGQIAPTFEIIFVEDCGGHESWSIITELAAADQRIRGIRVSCNYGQHNAALCGIRAAHYDVMVTVVRDVASRPTKLALASAMGGETARSASAFRTRLRYGFCDYRSPAVSIGALLTCLRAPSLAGRPSLRSRQWRSDRHQRLVFPADPSADVAQTSGGGSEPRRRRLNVRPDVPRVNEPVK